MKIPRPKFQPTDKAVQSEDVENNGGTVGPGKSSAPAKAKYRNTFKARSDKDVKNV